jgi:hypothetical protein
MSHETPLPSGVVLTVNCADYENADRLFRSVMTELRNAKADLGALASLGEDISPLVQGGMTLLASKEVSDALWSCASRCLYGHEKVTRKLFEAEDARQDVYPLLWEVAKVNLSPFFGSLVSMLKTGLTTAPVTQK